MPTIQGGTDSRVLKIGAFRGLNENPDGDTAMKAGELSAMRNWRVTRDGHLQIRPGTKTVLDLRQQVGGTGGHLSGAWHGYAGGQLRTLCVWSGVIWEVDPEAGTAQNRGTANPDKCTFFGFGNKVYLLNGHEYLGWDGVSSAGFTRVEGYIPTVQTATTPAGEGTLLESVNRLTPLRRVEFSPDGTAKTFQLPEHPVNAVVSCEGGGSYTADTAAGTVTFAQPPEKGVNTVRVVYRSGYGWDLRAQVERMRYSELYNGSTDTRVFLYGDGSNRCLYSGVPYETGQPSAEYFPDLNEAAVGESNTPLTAMVRHYSRLIAFKEGSTWSIQYGEVALPDGTSTAGFYVTPVNRQLGNEAPGEVKLLENEPLTLDGGGVYRWRSNSYGYISSSENSAKRISARVERTLASFPAAETVTCNRKREQEYWFLQGGRALILNYANDAWYYYDALPFQRLVETDGGSYGFCDDGRVVRLSREYRNDDGEPIDCYACTGAMDFGRDWQLKYSPAFFVAMQPENGARFYVTVESNRRGDYPDKLVAHSLATFTHVDFNHFSFATNRKPQVRRVKMKVKKAVFYRMIFKSSSSSATATVIETDVQLRYAGNVK